jgi:hypothetical protein
VKVVKRTASIWTMPDVTRSYCTPQRNSVHLATPYVAELRAHHTYRISLRAA